MFFAFYEHDPYAWNDDPTSAFQAITSFGCATTTACVLASNASTGPAVQGTSKSGIGVFGSGNTAVEGSDSAARSHYDDVFADGFGANLFRGNNSRGTDVFKVSDAGLVTMYQATVGNANTYTGLYAQGYPVGVNGVDLSASGGEGIRGDSSSSASSIAIYAQSHGGFLYDGDAGSGSVFYVDSAGNVHAHSFTADLAAAVRTANGATVQTYSHEVRAPTIEDFGEAMLAAGHAYVRLDPSFAGTPARGVPYFVFITPMGPTRGSLYVSQRTPTGFFVRENGGGASTVAFDYRIVGRRYGMAAMIINSVPKPSTMKPQPPSFTTHVKRATRPWGS